MSTEKPLPPEFEALAPEHPDAPGWVAEWEAAQRAGAITFTLSYAEMATLLQILGNAPYNRAAPLIEVIQRQTEQEFQRQSLFEQFAEMPTDAMGRA